MTSPTYNQPSFDGMNAGLSVNVGPNGLIDLTDEEFQVDGPRLGRYALNWAFFLGRQWMYQREAGEAQLTFNWFKAFTDFIAVFTFGRGFTVETPKATEAIVPDLLKRVWEVDNKKQAVLWKMAQFGGVTGDCFVKVAYEEPRVDSIGRMHPGRVRVLPLDSGTVFPTWHPHDPDRMIRVKVTYKFYGQTADGARTIHTYTEITDENQIAEYINDQLIQVEGVPNPRPNPIGTIPVVHIANTLAGSSPWGLADCHDVIPLNREYNEKATEISDIINYYGAPVTVVLGAKPNNLERGANKIWAIPQQGADIKNLEIGGSLAEPMQFLELIKRSMHEMTGVPESSLGQTPPISNTSGVALSIQYQSLMARFQEKVNQYGAGLEKINELILLTLAVKEPDAFVFDPGTDLAPLKDGQLSVLDPADPITYRTTVHFPPPLPIDKLILLNEIQLLQSLGLESREGALRQLGEQDPAEKLAEIRQELKEDAVADGALQLIKTQIQSEIMNLTGIMPTPDGGELPPMQDGPPDATGATSPQPQMPEPVMDAAMILDLNGEQELRNQIVTEAFGTTLPKLRNPDKPVDGETS